MQELTTTATLVDYETFAGGRPITAQFAREELEAALGADDSPQLWFELGLDDEDTKLLTLDLDTAALEQMLRIAGGDDVLVAFDSDAVAGLFDDPDVEAHGLRGALAIGVTSAAILAPAGQAAVTQSVDAASTVQSASAAATVQQASLAATAQVSAEISSLSATAQTAKARVAKAQVAKVQVSKVAKVSGLKLLRAGLVR